MLLTTGHKVIILVKHFPFKDVSEMNSDLLSVRQNKNMLLDFYGSLLTEKQRSIFEMHTVDDCSFTEIGAEFGITPQAVADFVKRALAQLEKYEEKLGLVAKFIAQEQTREEIENILEKLESDQARKIRKLLDKLVSYGI